jgi:DNA-directed RNA polymerase subunit K/omega
VIKRPISIGAFEFAVLAGLRAGQLSQGCVPRVPRSDKIAVTAQAEIAQRKIVRVPAADVAAGELPD